MGNHNKTYFDASHTPVPIAHFVPYLSKIRGPTSYLHVITNQSPTLGADTHAHGFWVGIGSVLVLMGEHGLKQSILERVIE